MRTSWKGDMASARTVCYFIGPLKPRKEDAVMEFPYRPELVDDAGRAFDVVVRKIQNRNFNVAVPPERKVCKECDLRTLCSREGLIQSFGRNE